MPSSEVVKTGMFNNLSILQNRVENIVFWDIHNMLKSFLSTRYLLVRVGTLEGPATTMPPHTDDPFALLSPSSGGCSSLLGIYCGMSSSSNRDFFSL